MARISPVFIAALGISAPGFAAVPSRPPVDPLQLARPSETVRPAPAAAPTAVAIDAPDAGQSDVAARVVVGAVNVEGSDALPPATYAAAIEPFLGKEADARELAALARAVANSARERGYIFATATVPAQSVDTGNVTVRLDIGDVAAVRVVGSSSRRLQRTLDKIVGTAVTRAQLERALLLAGDIPGVEIVSTRFVREAAGGVLIVDVRETRTEFAASADTYSARDLGPVRARLRYDFVGLADEGDVLSTQVVTTPLDPGRLTFATVRYAIPVGHNGAQASISASVGRAAPKVAAGTPRFVSTTIAGSVGGSVPLVRRTGASLWANAELGVQKTTGKTDGQPSQRDVVTTATASLYATAKTGTGRLSGSIGVVQGLPLGSVTRRGDPLSSRADGDAVFTKGFFSADWQQPIGRGFGIRLAASGQIADRPLLSSQEIGIGGPGSVRGYDFYERFGENGIMGSAELRWRKLSPFKGVDWMQFYGFADTGQVWNLDNGFGSGSLTSLGGGVRAALGQTDFTFELAAPVNAPREASGDKSPRVNISIGRRFR